MGSCACRSSDMPVVGWWRRTGRVTRVLVGFLVLVHVVLCTAFVDEPGR